MAVEHVAAAILVTLQDVVVVVVVAAVVAAHAHGELVAVREVQVSTVDVLLGTEFWK